jgi:hypothetical protein
MASRPLIQRANSQGASGFTSSGFFGVGPVPKSAKKWARTAHLHEVRVRDDKGQRETGSRDQVRGRDRESRENDSDVFTFPLKGHSSSPPVGHGDPLKVVDRKGKSPLFFSAHRTPFSPLPMRHPKDVDDSTDNDTWVDTDADCSELDLNSESEVQYSPKAVFADL